MSWINVLNSFHTNNKSESEVKRFNNENKRLMQDNIENGKFIETLINYSNKKKEVFKGNNWVDVSNKTTQTTEITKQWVRKQSSHFK